ANASGSWHSPEPIWTHQRQAKPAIGLLKSFGPKAITSAPDRKSDFEKHEPSNRFPSLAFRVQFCGCLLQFLSLDFSQDLLGGRIVVIEIVQSFVNGLGLFGFAGLL